MTSSDVKQHAADLQDGVREQLEHGRQVLEEGRERLEQARTDLEPHVRRARIGIWEVLSTIIATASLWPRIVVSALGALGDAVERMEERGSQVADRGREMVEAVPAVRAAKRRQRTMLVACTTAGVAAGAALGWWVARRRSAESAMTDPTWHLRAESDTDEVDQSDEAASGPTS